MKYKVMYQEQNYYNDKQRRIYSLLIIEEGMPSILYEYTTIDLSASKDNKYPSLRQPVYLYFTNAKTVSELNETNRSRYSSSKYIEAKGTPEEYNLYIPKHSDPITDIVITETKDSYVTDDMLEKIKKLDFKSPIVVIGEDMSRRKITSPDSIEIYYCTNCKKIYYYGENNGYNKKACPHCNTREYNNSIVSKSFKITRTKEFDSKYYCNATFSHEKTTQKERFLFISRHPDNENGIVLYKMVREISATGNTIHFHYGVEYSIEHIVGQKMICNKHLKKSIKECDPFEALNINTKNIEYAGTILYDDATDFTDFALKNEKFLRMSGFQAVLKYSPRTLELEPFFLVFIGIVNKYPIMEQIVKMGHAKLFFSLYQGMLESLNKEEMTDKIEKISQIVDPEAKKGKDALRFPIYIGDYLIKKDASIEEYFYWRDLYEITHITKEQFENLVDSFNYAWINSQAGIEDIGNILKFDYPVEKLFNYILKQARSSNNSVSDIIETLTDYLNMCDMCQIEPDKYPQDVQKVHNDMLIHFRDKQRIEYDKKLTLVGVECEKYVIPNEKELDNIGIPKLFKEMTVIFPKSEADFINEGNQQHNCVGSYPRRVRNGECVIFFIRKKDNPTKSFITAECTGSGLGQCYYSNNRYVEDEELRKFAKYIANKIRTGVSSGAIHALRKV